MIFARWKELRKLAFSFLATFFVLLSAATVISPHWPMGFWDAATRYMSYGLGPSIFQVMLPSALAFSAIMLLLGLLGWISWKYRAEEPGTLLYACSLALVAAATVALTTQAVHYQFLLVPAILILLDSIKWDLKPNFVVRVLTKATFACIFWQWGAAFILAFQSIFTRLHSTPMVAELPLWTSPAFPVLALAAMIAFTVWVKSNKLEIGSFVVHPCKKTA